MKTCFIVNPRSGRALGALAAVKKYSARHAAAVVLTERSRHATELAASAIADGCELIVSVGGDGTMNEVASAVADTPVTLGLVPCGSGDGLGRHLGIHGPVSRALEILQSGSVREIDVGFADGHPFFTAAGIGFEAEIAHRFNRLKRRGFLRYLTTSARAFRQWIPQHYTIIHADGRSEFEAFTLAVTNSDQYGNNAIIAPGARADDGLLDLCAIPPLTWRNFMPLSARLFSGHLDRQPGVLLRRGTEFVVERELAGPLHTDGEIHPAGRAIKFSIRHGSLKVMVPGNQQSLASRT